MTRGQSSACLTARRARLRLPENPRRRGGKNSNLDSVRKIERRLCVRNTIGQVPAYFERETHVRIAQLRQHRAIGELDH